MVILQRNSKRWELRCNFYIISTMHKALKKQQDRFVQRINWVFYDRSIQVEQLHFSIRWTNIFAQAANKLDEAGYPVELVSSAPQIYLKCTSFYMTQWQLKLNREYEEEPLLILAYTSFDPLNYINNIAPKLKQDILLRRFIKFSGQDRYCPLTGTDEEIISFICEVAIKLHLVFNK